MSLPRARFPRWLDFFTVETLLARAAFTAGALSIGAAFASTVEIAASDSGVCDSCAVPGVRGSAGSGEWVVAGLDPFDCSDAAAVSVPVCAEGQLGGIAGGVAVVDALGSFVAGSG